MKEMEYGNNKFEILDKGNYKGKDYVILNMRGSHPCAYVQSNINYYDREKYPGYDEPAHCGFTFYNTLSHWQYKVNLDEETKKLFNKYFVGWDYGHFGDYTAPFFDYPEELLSTEDKKWTTKEILDNVKEVIEWMIGKESK